MNNYNNIITQASKIVFNVAQHNFSQLKNKNITQKKDGSFVTDFDTAIDNDLIQNLSQVFPKIPFISEESQPDELIIKGLSWCIDPIDGTHNFMMNIPYYAVSVGLLYDGKPVAGIIYNPLNDNLLVGGESIPLTLNGSTISINNSSMIITTNRSHSLEDKEKEALLIQRILTSSSLKYRRFGSCALDIMHLILGNIGAVYIIGNNQWDWAAGYAIARSSGITISQNDDYILMNSPHLREHMVK
jgi:myo-inositol-1(or 4)-monophosphatase